MMRTKGSTVRFTRPFALEGIDGVHPPGTYEVEIDEEPLSGLSFPIYRRIEVRITLPWHTMGAIGFQTVVVRFEDLEAALAMDSAAEAFDRAP